MLTECAVSFQLHIAALAERCGKSDQEVYGWWRQYCRDCDAYDQSPVLSEFERWYAEKLAP